MTRALRTFFLLLLFAALAPRIYQYSQNWAAKPFWDPAAYGEALEDYIHGGSAYIVPGFTPTDYPPIFILAGVWFAKILTPAVGWKVFLAAHIVSTVALPFLLARFYLRGMGYLEAFLLFALAPLCLTVEVFFSGNVASICYFLALLAAVPGVRSNRWIWLYIVTVLASSIKITFLLFLLLPLFLGLAQILPSVIAIAATFGVYVAQRIFVPGLYGEFRQMLVVHTLEHRNYGYGPYGMTANLLQRFHIRSQIVPGVIEILFGLAIMWALLQLRKSVDLKDPRWLAIIVLTMLLLNPRLVDYDTVVGLLPAYFLLLPNWQQPSTIALLIISAAGFFIGHGVLGFLLLFISAFITGYRSLMSAPAPATDARLVAAQ